MSVMTGLVLITAMLCATLLAMAWIGSNKK